ncbi:MAG: type VI secretion system protein TssA [Pirellulaceae bacterium]|jgi:type VI secretion system protein ImpA|nr:type VI secretion system protein TssA [Pirellulaceae bacterium]
MLDTTIDLDLAALLAPITPEQPAGVDLRKTPDSEAVFTAAKDAFDSAAHWEEEAEKAKDPYLEPHERELLMRNLRAPDWDAVRAQAAEILQRRAKDLRVAAWLVEALIRTRGWAGLKFGLQLLRELCQTHWEHIHERPDVSGLTTTVAPLAKLGRRFCLQAIRAMPILDSPACGKLSALDYRASQNLEKITDPDVRQQQINDGVLPLAEFELAARQASADDWAGIRTLVDAARDELDALNTWLNAQCGSAAPVLSGIATALGECAEVVEQLAPAEEASVADTAAAPAADTTSGPAAAPSAITRREEAFAALRRVAQYFRDHEPQSPLAWQLERVVRLGQLDFPELLVEVVRDQDLRAALARDMGTDPPATAD